MEEIPNVDKDLTNSVYHVLQNKCGKTINEIPSIEKYVAAQPSVIKVEEGIKNLNRDIEELQANAEIDKMTQRNIIRQIRGLLKTKLSDEALVLTKLRLIDEVSKMKELSNNNSVRSRIIQLKKDKNISKKKRKKYIGTLTKRIIKQVKVNNSTRKAEVAFAKKERILQIKAGVIVQELKDGILKEMVKKYSDNIDDELFALGESAKEKQEHEDKRQKEHDDANEAKKELRRENSTRKKLERETIKLANAMQKRDDNAKVRIIKLAKAIRKKEALDVARVAEAIRKKDVRDEAKLAEATRKKYIKDAKLANVTRKMVARDEAKLAEATRKKDKKDAKLANVTRKIGK